MSADNYYIIRKHPDGGFVALHGFMSDDYPRTFSRTRDENLPVFKTPEEACDSVADEYTEYGTRFHPECVTELQEIRLQSAITRVRNLCDEFEKGGSLMVPIVSIRAALDYKEKSDASTARRSSEDAD